MIKVIKCSFFILSIIASGPAWANDFALILGSRPNHGGAIEFAKSLVGRNPHITSIDQFLFLQSFNGWMAVTLGVSDRASCDAKLATIKGQTSIPRDAYCSTTSRFTDRLIFSSGALVSTTAVAASSAPVRQATPAQTGTSLQEAPPRVTEQQNLSPQEQVRIAIDQNDFRKAIHILAPLAEPAQTGTSVKEARNSDYALLLANTLMHERNTLGNERTREAEALRFYRAAARGGNAEAANILGGWAIEEKAGLNSSEAVSWYLVAAEQRHTDAILELCSLRSQGVSKRTPNRRFNSLINQPQGFYWCAEAANLGDAASQMYLGGLYFYRRNTPEDTTEGLRWYRRAAEQQNIRAQSHLGFSYSRGWYGESNDVEAAQWLRKAAEQGDAAAHFELGILVSEGRGVEKNLLEAITLLKAAAAQNFVPQRSGLSEIDIAKRVVFLEALVSAEAGDARAQVNVAWDYLAGANIVKNESAALTWFRRAVEQGSPEGMIGLGGMYEIGQGIDKNGAAALELYRRAASLGNTDAMIAVGEVNQLGRGTPKNEAEAVNWYRKAADAGSARGACRLGIMYLDGSGVRKDANQALSFFKKSAESGDLRCMVVLGQSYHQGTIVNRDYNEAIRWYRTAHEKGFRSHVNLPDNIRFAETAIIAEQGDPAAQVQLGTMYLNGIGVNRDDNEAARWYRKASEQAHADGMLNLGRVYSSGSGVAKDEAEATLWYRRAAGLGHPKAMLAMGEAYKGGRGVAQNEAEARRWHHMAASNGLTEAQLIMSDYHAGRMTNSEDRILAIMWLRIALPNVGGAQEHTRNAAFANLVRSVPQREVEEAMRRAAVFRHQR